MIKVEHIDTWGLAHAVRGMRNPMNSWSFSDTVDDVIGKRDAILIKKLIASGSEHRKFLRQIFISMDITAPLYWWKEFDTYKVGTVANSCSTMHKIHEKPFKLNDFSWEQLLNTGCDLFESKIPTGEFCYTTIIQPLGLMLDYIIPALNVCREKYLETKDKKYWWQMIQLLPSSYNQRRTITMDYENAFNMIHQRAGHKLDEWREFVEVLRKLPGMALFLEAVNDSD